jgi:acetyl-CoA C-acetyltransferase
MAEFVLHCMAQSGHSYKVALMLELCGADWEASWVDFFNGQTRLFYVRTPRGRGKKDGSLHEVPSVRPRLAHARSAARPQRDSTPKRSMTWSWAASMRSAKPAATSPARPSSKPVTRHEAPGIQINRFCASGLDAINFGTPPRSPRAHDIVIAGGVESMSRIGIGAQGGAWFMDPSVNIPSYFMPQGISADLIATKYGFSPRRCRRLCDGKPEARGQAWEKGYFDKSVVPVKDINGLTILDRDEHMRPGTDMQALASLNASFGMMAEMGGFGAVAIQAHPESKASTTSTMPATPRASSTAPAWCCSAPSAAARPWVSSRARGSRPSPISARTRR